MRHESPGWRRAFRPTRKNIQADVADELAFHVEMRIRDLIDTGLSPAAARERAEREFGDVPPVHDACVAIDERRTRHHNRTEVISDMWHDLRVGARILRSAPAFTLTALK